MIAKNDFTSVETVRQVDVVFRTGFRFGVVSYWQAVSVSSDSEKYGLFSVVQSRIFRARVFAMFALEDSRIRLLSVLHHTAKPRRELKDNCGCFKRRAHETNAAHKLPADDGKLQ